MSAQISNPGFESPNLGGGSWIEPPPAGSDWTALGHAGIANGQGSWGEAPHSGSQYAFLQMGGSLAQTIAGLDAGSQYRISFWIARRSGDMGADYGELVGARINDALVLAPTMPPSNGSWQQVVSAPFTAAGTSVDLVIEGIGSPESDTSTLIDDVAIERVV